MAIQTGSNRNGDLGQLEERLGHRFTDRGLLVRALTHRSFANESGAERSDNEVLEFLGDAVLGFVVSDILCQRHPDLSEGEMSKLKSQLVSAETLALFADRLQLGSFVLLGRGEEKTDGRHKNSILANSLEAVIAALYIDGGLDRARAFVLGRIDPLLGELRAGEVPQVRDFKSALQERVQAAGFNLPRYEVVEEQGPDHAKLFHVRVRVADAWQADGEGRTKKRAEQQAARELLSRLADRGTEMPRSGTDPATPEQ